VNQFKAEMTSMKNNPDKPIFLIGTTNHADQIEDAMLDRFTYKIEVFLPDLDAVKAALNRLAKKMQLTDEAKNYLQNEMATKIHQHDELRSFRSMGNYMQKAAYIAYSQHKEKVGKEQLDAAFASLAQRTPLNDKYLESLPDVPALDLNNPTPEEIKAALPSDLQDDTTLTIDPTAKTVKITANPTNSKYTGEIEVAYTTTTKPAPTPEPNNTPDKK
ncbi:AAA family ATPase, partial [Candidatus Phytoplasma pruni]